MLSPKDLIRIREEQDIEYGESTDWHTNVSDLLRYVELLSSQIAGLNSKLNIAGVALVAVAETPCTDKGEACASCAAQRALEDMATIYRASTDGKAN